MNTCRGCEQPVDKGYNWHKQCLAAYRSAENYRQKTLARDGFNCAKCPSWWNRTVADWYEIRNNRLSWLPRLRRERWVQVDHIDPIGGTGTHDPTNLQVLCQGAPFKHHPRKTRRDLAHLKGQKLAWRPTRVQLLITAGVALAVTIGLTGASWPAAAALLTLTVAGVVTHLQLSQRRQTLHTTYAKVTGAAVTHTRRALRTRKWRLRKVDGRKRPLLVPTDQDISYPESFNDHDPEKQAELEQVVIAKNGPEGGWVPTWYTPLNRLRMTSPDPLQVAKPIPSPLLTVASTSVWEPIPVAHDSHRRPINVTMIGKNWLIGGEPEAGKSVGQSGIVTSLALDVSVDLVLMDLKGGVELGVWEDCSSLPVATTIEEALAHSEYLREIIEFRAALLRRESKQTGRRKVKIEQGDGMGPIGVIVDELAELTSHPDKKKRDEFIGSLRSNISRGRFVGIMHVLATQRPSAQVVPTDVRDIINQRWAFRHTTPSSSDMTLGAGQAARGFSAHRVSTEARGVGLIYSDGRDPIRARSYYLDSADVQRVAAKAVRLRRAASGSVLPAQAA